MNETPMWKFGLFGLIGLIISISLIGYAYWNNSRYIDLKEKINELCVNSSEIVPFLGSHRLFNENWYNVKVNCENVNSDGKYIFGDVLRYNVSVEE